MGAVACRNIKWQSVTQSVSLLIPWYIYICVCVCTSVSGCVLIHVQLQQYPIIGEDPKVTQASYKAFAPNLESSGRVHTQSWKTRSAGSCSVSFAVTISLFWNTYIHFKQDSWKNNYLIRSTRAAASTQLLTLYTLPGFHPQFQSHMVVGRIQLTTSTKTVKDLRTFQLKSCIPRRPIHLIHIVAYRWGVSLPLTTMRIEVSTSNLTSSMRS